MTEYTDIVEAMRLRIKEEKEKKMVTFLHASGGKYLLGRKDGSTQVLTSKEFLNLKE